jgi:hypothetical protein
MKPWHGDDRAPADWNGGPVLMESVSGWRTMASPDRAGDERWLGFAGDYKVVAYTPKTPPAASSGQDLRALIGDLDQATALIQEAKGEEGPDGGFITDHLDFAEHWINKVRDTLEAALISAPAVQPSVPDIECGHCAGVGDIDDGDHPCMRCGGSGRVTPAVQPGGDLVDRIREAFEAGWDARELKETGPSAAGYCDESYDVNMAWPLFDPANASGIDADWAGDWQYDTLSARADARKALAPATPQPEAEEGE